MQEDQIRRLQECAAMFADVPLAVVDSPAFSLAPGEQAERTLSSHAVSSCERVWRAGRDRRRALSAESTRSRNGVLR